MNPFKEVPYVPEAYSNPFHKFDLYPVPAADSAPLICFVHGGAWRSEDKADHGILAKKLALHTNCSVAVPNYRTHGSLRHPAHAQDLLQFLEFVATWKGPGGLTPMPYDPQRIYVIGHSCSAHMLTSILLDSSAITPTLTPTPSLLRAIQGVVMSEGIYDLELLLSDFPEYLEWFVGPTFGEDTSLSHFSTTKYTLRDSSAHIRWLVIHSTGDRLVNLPQSEAILSHLSQLYGWQTTNFISKNFDELTGAHNDIITKANYIEIYTKIVRDFIVI